jgi:hypothetical protein
LSKKSEEIFDQRLEPSGRQLDYDLFLYDETSTYFEGEGKLNPLAQGGVTHGIIVGIASKSVLVWLVTRNGFPIDFNRKSPDHIESVSSLFVGGSRRFRVLIQRENHNRKEFGCSLAGQKGVMSFDFSALSFNL